MTEEENNVKLRYMLEKDIENWEGKEIEFIGNFPSNIHELAKEMAAFSTSNSGRIYLGVDKNKKMTGLSKISSIRDTKGKYEVLHSRDTKGKDEVLNRLAGITRSSVKPPITVTPYFIDIIEEDMTILRIDVPKGTEPLYFSSNVPYIRNLSTSDVATPDQIKELYKEYLISRGYLISKQLPHIDNYGKCNPTKKVIIEKDKYSSLERFNAKILSFSNNVIKVELSIPGSTIREIIFGSGCYYIFDGIEGDYIFEVTDLSADRIELLMGSYLPISREEIDYCRKKLEIFFLLNFPSVIKGAWEGPGDELKRIFRNVRNNINYISDKDIMKKLGRFSEIVLEPVRHNLLAWPEFGGYDIDELHKNGTLDARRNELGPKIKTMWEKEIWPRLNMELEDARKISEKIK